jgi:prepilin-type N-terminal cleavage/methylation domain-containing protein
MNIYPPPNATDRVSGFSLVELSIVLVILGLLTGGILTGQSLIKAAELRAVTTEFNQFQTAINTFKSKYFALPGDMANATLFWGKLAAYCNGHVGTAQTNGTCNGNDNKLIEAPSAPSQAGELFTFWQHLALSGMIEGNYTGVAGAADESNHIPNVNSPKSKFANASWGLEDLQTAGGNHYDTNYNNTIEFGSTTGTGDADNPALIPEEAWNIDKKIDDGKPARGKVIAKYWNNACAAADDGTHANNDLNASYKLSATTIECSLIFNNAF